LFNAVAVKLVVKRLAPSLGSEDLGVCDAAAQASCHSGFDLVRNQADPCSENRTHLCRTLLRAPASGGLSSAPLAAIRERDSGRRARTLHRERRVGQRKV
jgi:hypothetical protein